jgi:hypothetical protein
MMRTYSQLAREADVSIEPVPKSRSAIAGSGPSLFFDESAGSDFQVS